MKKVIWRNSLRDGDMKKLVLASSIETIKELKLNENNVTDADILLIRQLTSLSVLHLSGTGINDISLRHLTGLDNLEYIDLSYNYEITDQGFKEFINSTRNISIDFSYTGISGEIITEMLICSDILIRNKILLRFSASELSLETCRSVEENNEKIKVIIEEEVKEMKKQVESSFHNLQGFKDVKTIILNYLYVNRRINKYEY
jgi:Leucine-rich repeat (LRR) protein